MPALWPLRLPASPIVISDQGRESNPQTDALVLLDEELHTIRLIPLTGDRSGQISTVSGSIGSQGNLDGWTSRAQFLLPQSLISIPHPLTAPDAGQRSWSMEFEDRQALLVADIASCMRQVNSVKSAEEKL
jgi:hypothetical protein